MKNKHKKKATEKKEEYNNTIRTDKTHQTGCKVDYYSVLKRRRRTAKDFINEHNITSVGKLLNVLHAINAKDYDISAEFVKDTMRVIEERKAQKEIKISIPSGPTDIVSTPSNIEIVPTDITINVTSITPEVSEPTATVAKKKKKKTTTKKKKQKKRNPKRINLPKNNTQ